MRKLMIYAVAALLAFVLFGYNSVQANNLAENQSDRSTALSGPVGGPGGIPFSDEGLVSEDQSIAEMLIQHGKYVDRIGLVAQDPDSHRDPLPKHGGNGGTESRIALAPDEYITGIEGRYGDWLVHSMSVQSNKRTYGPYGGSGGTATYNFQTPDAAEVVGFVGRSGGLLDAVGIVYRDRSLSADDSAADAAKPENDQAEDEAMPASPETTESSDEEGFFERLLHRIGL